MAPKAKMRPAKRRKDPADTALRRLAEEKLGTTMPEPDALFPNADVGRLVHELQVHKIELELQNEELIVSHMEAGAALVRYSDLYDFAPVGYLTLERDGTIEQSNLNGARLLGLARAELAGRRFGSFLAPASLPLFNQFMTRVFGSTEQQRCELTLALDGLPPVDLQVEAARPLGHRVCRLALTDVTAHNAAEATLRIVTEQLRESQKMESLGTLAGGVAHDFNNILSSIMGNVTLAEGALEPGHRAQECMREIRVAGTRAADLVRQILTLSRRHRLEQSVVSLGPIVEEAVRLLRTTIPAGIEIVTTIDPLLPELLANATQIHQVVMNMGTNAWLALRDVPAVAGHAPRIEIGISECTFDEAAIRALPGGLSPGRFLRLSVADNGRGMSPEVLARIFEPFFTTRVMGDGTGLGLSMVHGIVTAHHGTIVVRSTLGAGTVFEVYFPAATAEAVAQAGMPRPPLERATVPSVERHILYVDDEPQLVSMVTRLMRREGHRVTGFSDPREALEALRAEPDAYDLVISDYQMPALSGLDVAREVKALRPGLPVMIASGSITADLEGRFGATGIHALVYKPDMADELCRLVRALFPEPVPVVVAQ